MSPKIKATTPAAQLAAVSLTSLIGKATRADMDFGIDNTCLITDQSIPMDQFGLRARKT